MGKAIAPLTLTKIKTAKPKEKDYKLFDGGGLFLLVTKRKTKLWRLKYKFNGKEKLLALGAFPTVSLARARELREINKELLLRGIDPMELKKEKKEAEEEHNEKRLNTFKKVALERLEKNRDILSESHYKRTLRGFTNDTFPFIGDKLIDEVEAMEIIQIVNRMMERGIRNSAQKVFQAISKTFKYAVAHGYATRNPTQDIDLVELIGKSNAQKYPTITDDKEIKNLLASIHEYQGETSTRYALLMLAYTAVRPSNARLALWSEIDFNTKQWVIPAKKMKTKDEFIVPLSTSLFKLLQEVREYSGDSLYLFPSTKSKTTPLSDGALLGAIRRMGYTKEEFTPHGFRSMFSTIANEKSPFKSEVIETQLAHTVGNSVSQAYNRAKYLKERKELMEWWGNYLDEVQK
jgi:integrase